MPVISDGKESREWDISLAVAGEVGEDGLVKVTPIDRMFDSSGSETFDPTETVEVALAGADLRSVEPGDTFVFNLVSD